MYFFIFFLSYIITIVIIKGKGVFKKMINKKLIIGGLLDSSYTDSCYVNKRVIHNMSLGANYSKHSNSNIKVSVIDEGIVMKAIKKNIYNIDIVKLRDEMIDKIGLFYINEFTIPLGDCAVKDVLYNFLCQLPLLKNITREQMLELLTYINKVEEVNRVLLCYTITYVSESEIYNNKIIRLNDSAVVYTDLDPYDYIVIENGIKKSDVHIFIVDNQEKVNRYYVKLGNKILIIDSMVDFNSCNGLYYNMRRDNGMVEEVYVPMEDFETEGIYRDLDSLNKVNDPEHLEKQYKILELNRSHQIEMKKLDVESKKNDIEEAKILFSHEKIRFDYKVLDNEMIKLKLEKFKITQSLASMEAEKEDKNRERDYNIKRFSLDILMAKNKLEAEKIKTTVELESSRIKLSSGKVDHLTKSLGLINKIVF